MILPVQGISYFIEKVLTNLIHDMPREDLHSPAVSFVFSCFGDRQQSLVDFLLQLRELKYISLLYSLRRDSYTSVLIFTKLRSLR